MPKFTRKSAGARKIELLGAALPLFAAKGFAATTTREIARAANVSDALLYKYFPNKESIYRELMAFCVGKVESAGARLELMEKNTASFVRAVYFLMYVVRFGGPEVDSHKACMDKLLLQDLLGNGDVIRLFHAERIAPWIEKLKDYYLATIDAGDATGDRASALNRLWLAQQLAFVIQIQSLPGQNTVRFRGHERQVFEEAVVFALRGLGLTQQAIDRYFDPIEIYEFVQKVFAESEL